jgi:two-component system nitrate/nitrite response regulator NarP
MVNMTISVMVIDDHDIFRRGIIQLLNQTNWACVVGQADSVDSSLRNFESTKPEILLLDLYLGHGIKTFEMIPEYKRLSPETKVVLLTVSEDDSDIFEAAQYEVDGYILKNTPFSILEEYLQNIYAGEILISDSLGSSLFKELKTKHTAIALSTRERDVLQLLRKGYPNKLIARELYISENTVKIHVSNIMRKLNVHRRSEIY